MNGWRCAICTERRQGAFRTDLAIPSALTLRIAICGAKAVADSDALIIGTARTAADRLSVDSAIVTAQWVEVVLDRGRVRRNVVRRQTRTLATGWFAICGAPIRGAIALDAVHGPDSTIVLELDAPPSGFLRRDLYFGGATQSRADTTLSPGSVASTPAVQGDGRLTGIVVCEVGGKPLVGARVGMVTLESVLETVRVTAKQNGSGNLLQFLSHRRTSGFGRFLTREDLDNRNALFTSDIFRTMAGLVAQADRLGQTIITMRGTLAGRCQPTFFLNGTIMRFLSAGDIDSFLRPNELIGVKVYTGVLTPAQSSAFGSCGSIVFWTR